MDRWVFFFVPFTAVTADKRRNNSQIRGTIGHIPPAMCSVLNLLSGPLLLPPTHPTPLQEPPPSPVTNRPSIMLLPVVHDRWEIREMGFFKPCADLTYGSTYSKPPTPPHPTLPTPHTPKKTQATLWDTWAISIWLFFTCYSGHICAQGRGSGPTIHSNLSRVLSSVIVFSSLSFHYSGWPPVTASSLRVLACMFHQVCEILEPSRQPASQPPEL